MDKVMETGSLLRDRYRIKRTLYSSRFYNYYDAEDTGSKNMPVLIAELLLLKLPPSGRKVSQEQFLEQIDLCMTLSHPVLPTVTDGFFHNDAAYIVQKQREGISIKQYLSMAINNFTAEDAINRILSIGNGLSYLYNRPTPIPFCHLDADHILIDMDGNVNLTGFGLHIFLDYYFSSMDPYAYCAPEIAEGKPFSVRSAVYSLGALLYNMLTGIKFDIRRSDNPRLVEVVSKIPPGLDETVGKALAKDPSHRFIDLESFMKKLQSVIAPPDQTPEAEKIEENKASKSPGEGTLQKETNLLVKRIVKGMIVVAVIMAVAMVPFFIRTLTKAKVPPGADNAYILNEERNQVLIFAVRSATRLATVSFLGTAEAMALSNDGEKLCIARKERNLLIADAKSGITIGSFPIDDEPSDLIAVRPGPYFYLTCLGSSDITVWDSDSHAATSMIKSESRHDRLSSSPDGSTVYAAGKDDPSVAIIDTETKKIKGTISSEAGMEDMATNRDGSLLFLVSDREEAYFFKTGERKLEKKIRLEKGTKHIASSRGSDAPDCMYVASEQSRSIVRLDCNGFAITKRILTRGIPRALAVSGNGKVLYAVTVFPESLVIIDSANLNPIIDYPVPFRSISLLVN